MLSLRQLGAVQRCFDPGLDVPSTRDRQPGGTRGTESRCLEDAGGLAPLQLLLGTRRVSLNC